MIFVCIGRILPSIHENEKSLIEIYLIRAIKVYIYTLTTSEKI